MGTATEIKDTSRSLPGRVQVAKLYQLNPVLAVPIWSTDTEFRVIEFVVVSAVLGPGFAGIGDLHETMVFEANSEGKIVDWFELACVLDTMDHAEALMKLGDGYKIAPLALEHKAS